jgi:predicted dehydrogenase
MKTLVIGYGSIGMRHTEVLSNLGCTVSIVSKRKLNIERCYLNIKEAIDEEEPEYIVIATKTHEHISRLIEIKQLGFKGPILIEKPLSNNFENIPEGVFNNVFVAYNLRFNPLIHRLFEEIQGEYIISAQAYVGQYLPSWRPNRDYRKTYSSKKVEGGGVLRDLSHELDIMNWLLGGWRQITAIGGHFSKLEIDSDDVFSLMLEMKKCLVSTVQLNYLDRATRRDIIINTNNHVFRVDLIKNIFQKDSDEFPLEFDTNYSYRMQHKAIMDNNDFYLCNFESGKDVMSLIDAAEKSAYSENNIWIKNEKNL